MNIIRKIYDWMGKKVHSKYANLWLAALFFIEAIFFIPVDPLLILFCVENSKKSLKNMRNSIIEVEKQLSKNKDKWYKEALVGGLETENKQ